MRWAVHLATFEITYCAPHQAREQRFKPNIVVQTHRLPRNSNWHVSPGDFGASVSFVWASCATQRPWGRKNSSRCGSTTEEQEQGIRSRNGGRWGDHFRYPFQMSFTAKKDRFCTRKLALMFKTSLSGGQSRNKTQSSARRRNAGRSAGPLPVNVQTQVRSWAVKLDVTW